MNTLLAVAADARLFDGTGNPATVAYVSETAVNLRAPANRWLMLCDARLGCGPRTVLVHAGSTLAGAMSVGETVTIGKSSLIGNTGEIVTWQDAMRWQPSPLPSPATATTTATATATATATRNGLSAHLSQAADLVAQHGCLLARPLISRPVLALRNGCLNADPSTIRHAVADLTGLGPGLTPAGDDYLGGYLTALLHIVPANPAAFTVRELVVGAVQSLAPGSTHPMSEFLLGEYAAGMIPEFLDECLRALLHPSTTQHLSACVLRVLDHGATSGTEMMLGILDAVTDFRVGLIDNSWHRKDHP